MKYILFLLIILGLLGCADKFKKPLIGENFDKFNDIEYLARFKKVSDSSFYNYEEKPEHRLLHLKLEQKDLIVFSKTTFDSSQNTTQRVLDTLGFLNLGSNEGLTINYCEIDLKSNNKGNIIALIQNTDGSNMFIEKVLKAWIANPDTEKIEPLNDIKNIQCLNEFYSGEEEKINYDLLNK